MKKYFFSAILVITFLLTFNNTLYLQGQDPHPPNAYNPADPTSNRPALRPYFRGDSSVTNPAATQPIPNTIPTEQPVSIPQPNNSLPANNESNYYAMGNTYAPPSAPRTVPNEYLGPAYVKWHSWQRPNGKEILAYMVVGNPYDYPSRVIIRAHNNNHVVAEGSAWVTKKWEGLIQIKVASLYSIRLYSNYFTVAMESPNGQVTQHFKSGEFYIDWAEGPVGSPGLHSYPEPTPNPSSYPQPPSPTPQTCPTPEPQVDYPKITVHNWNRINSFMGQLEVQLSGAPNGSSSIYVEGWGGNSIFARGHLDLAPCASGKVNVSVYATNNGRVQTDKFLVYWLNNHGATLTTGELIKYVDWNYPYDRSSIDNYPPAVSLPDTPQTPVPQEPKQALKIQWQGLHIHNAGYTTAKIRVDQPANGVYFIRVSALDENKVVKANGYVKLAQGATGNFDIPMYAKFNGIQYTRWILVEIFDLEQSLVSAEYYDNPANWRVISRFE